LWDLSLSLAVDGRQPLPLYAQLETGIRAAIAQGRLRAGEQLPTVRQLAVELRVNANTVARVYGELERAEVLETRRGVGTFVRSGQEPQGRAARERELRRICERFLAEARAQGFAAEEVLRHLGDRVRKEK
jgi:GntR family transcriptional regulator